MNTDVKEFIKMIEERQSKYNIDIAEIRNNYAKEIPEDDVVTPHIIWKLKEEKKKLDKKWGIEGKLSIERAFKDEEDASANLYYSFEDLICVVSPKFKNSDSRLSRHRKESEIASGLDISAHISHPYLEGDHIWARSSKDRTNWEILYTHESTGRTSIKARTKNFVGLKSLRKILKSFEEEWNIVEKGHISHD